MAITQRDATSRRFQRLALAVLTLGGLIGAEAAPLAAQGRPRSGDGRRDDNDDDDERDIPFGSDRLFVPRLAAGQWPARARRVPHRRSTRRGPRRS